VLSLGPPTSGTGCFFVDTGFCLDSVSEAPPQFNTINFERALGVEQDSEFSFYPL